VIVIAKCVVCVIVSVNTGEGNCSLRHAANSSRRNNSSRMKMNVWCKWQTCSIAPACSSFFLISSSLLKKKKGLNFRIERCLPIGARG
jgi:hypothetical protein